MNLKLMRKRTFITILLFVISFTFYGQDDWSKLSAKQKIKIAKKEQKAAKKDPEYLKLMDDALLLFQAGKYDEAITKYQAAHDRRPDNVYPVVMLEDIEVALNLPEENKTEEIVEDITPEVEVKTEKIVEETEPEAIEVTSDIEINEEITDIKVETQQDDVVTETIEPEIIVLPIEAEKPTEVPKPTPNAEQTTTRVQVQKEYLNDGIYKDSFKEGNADVEQVMIVDKGVETVYRKVSHPWGAIYYFKGEDSISEKEWKDLLIKIQQD